MNAIFLQNQIHYINQFYHHNIYIYMYFVIATYPLMVYILNFTVHCVEFIKFNEKKNAIVFFLKKIF